jgi:hypothetical protein
LFAQNDQKISYYKKKEKEKKLACEMVEHTAGFDNLL